MSSSVQPTTAAVLPLQPIPAQLPPLPSVAIAAAGAPRSAAAPFSSIAIGVRRPSSRVPVVAKQSNTDGTNEASPHLLPTAPDTAAVRIVTPKAVRAQSPPAAANSSLEPLKLGSDSALDSQLVPTIVSSVLSAKAADQQLQSPESAGSTAALQHDALSPFTPFSS